MTEEFFDRLCLAAKAADRIRAVKRHLVGVDIGGSKIAVLVREAGTDREVHSDKLATPVRGGVGATLRVLDEQMEKLPGGRSSVVALGVAVPGCVDPDGRVVCAGNLDIQPQLLERLRAAAK